MRVFIVNLYGEEESQSYLVHGVRTTEGAKRKCYKRLKENKHEKWWNTSYTYAYELNLRNDVIPI